MNHHVFRNAFNRHTFAMMIAFAMPLVSFAGLSYLGIIESWGFYVLFLLFPLAYILMMASLHPTPQKVVADNITRIRRRRRNENRRSII